MMEERTTFRHVHAITGTFVLAVAGVIVAIIVLAGLNQRWFIRNVTLQIVLPESGAAGIRQGSEVYFLGTLVGAVSDVRIYPPGRSPGACRRPQKKFPGESLRNTHFLPRIPFGAPQTRMPPFWRRVTICLI